ncbi:MAG: HEAT repeat domain-containing protein, partial [Gemmatimonadetes bacterium]|nr:HEAT repeat domain-containing protein [Gemmatimonadota bacterium]
LTLLWEADLRCMRHRFVDLLAEGIEIPEPGEGADPQALQEAQEEAKQSGAAGQPASATISREDFNPTLYSLDAREMELLQQEVRKEMDRDLRSDVLSALFDRVEEPDLPERQAEILAILRVLLPNFLSRGALASTAAVLRELRALEEREGVLDGGGRRKLAMVVDELSSPATVDELVRALEEGSISATAGELGELLTHFRPAALGPLLRASELTEDRDLQKVLREAVRGIAERNRAAIPGLLQHADPVVVAGAARLAGRMEVTEAGPFLAGLMEDEDRDVRLAAVEATVMLKASTAAGALERVLDDPDRDVRIAAARALGELRYRPAARALREAITGKDLRSADLSEKIAFFEGYGELGDEKGVELLDRLLNGRGFLGRKEAAEIRACAALALGRMESPAARAPLEAAAGDDDPVVRNAVSRALRGEKAT